MENALKKNTLVSIVSSLIFLLIGIIIVLNPSTIMSIITYCLGTIFIVIGGIKIIVYFLNRKEMEIYTLDLMLGIFLIAVGIFIIICGGMIETLFRLVIGIWIIYSGIMRFMSAIRLKGVGVSIWPMLVVISAIMILAGIYILVTSGSLMMSLGYIMIAYAIMDLLQGVIFYFNIKKLI